MLSAFAHYKLLLFGILLVASVNLFPDGVASLIFERRQRKDSTPRRAERRASNPSTGVVKINDLSVRIGQFQILERLSAEIVPGLVNVIVGPNGAGKTSVLNILTGYLKPSTGTVTVGGRQFSSISPSEALEIGFVRTFQSPRAFPSLTFWENVHLGCLPINSLKTITGVFTGEKTLVTPIGYDAIVNRLQPANNGVSELSFSDRRKLELCRAALIQPKFLLLDEPSSGLDEHEVSELIENLRFLRDSGVTLVIVSHDGVFIRKVGDRIIAVDAGRVVAQGPVESVDLSEYVHG